jgi:hypothetical protein
MNSITEVKPSDYIPNPEADAQMPADTLAIVLVGAAVLTVLLCLTGKN